MSVIKIIFSFILNIILLALIILLCFDFLIFSARQVSQDKFQINVLHIFFISIQYYFIIKVQNKYSEKLNKILLYSKTKSLITILISVMLFISIFNDFELYTYAIFMFILFSIISFLSNEMKYYILIQFLCLLAIYLSENYTIIQGLTVKLFIIKIAYLFGIETR